MDLDNRTSVGPTVKSLVSPATLNVFLIVNNLTFCCTLSAFGIFTNLVNIIVYCKMGFSESVNAKFCALSVFDFLLSLFTLITKLFYSRVVGGRNLAASQITTLPRFVAACGSNMMTALISAERCVCVLFPLKVKTLLTRRRSLYLLLIVLAYPLIFLITIHIEAAPPYDANRYPKKLGFYLFYMYSVPTAMCFSIVVISTILLVASIRRKQQWRKDTSTQSDKNKDKERRLAKTIIAITTIFIVCLLPYVGLWFAPIVYPRFNYVDPYFGPLLNVLYTFTDVLQALSSSVNIFFYYRMSSKYNKVLSSFFFVWKKENA